MLYLWQQGTLKKHREYCSSNFRNFTPEHYRNNCALLQKVIFSAEHKHRRSVSRWSHSHNLRQPDDHLRGLGHLRQSVHHQGLAHSRSRRWEMVHQTAHWWIVYVGFVSFKKISCLSKIRVCSKDYFSISIYLWLAFIAIFPTFSCKKSIVFKKNKFENSNSYLFRTTARRDVLNDPNRFYPE